MGLFGKRADRPGGNSESRPAGTEPALVPLLFGDLPLDQWPGADTSAQGAPWDSFIAAQAELAAEHRDEAIRLWLHIAARTDIEARHVLQAWTFLRQAGVAPDPEHAKDVLGVVVSVPVRDGHDVLAAYRDGSVRYINFSGAAVVVDDAPPAVGDAGRSCWIREASWLAALAPVSDRGRISASVMEQYEAAAQ